MTVSQNIGQSVQAAEVVAKSPAARQTCVRETGSFVTIFESLTDTENPAMSESARPDQKRAKDAKTGANADESGSACLAALISGGNDSSDIRALGKGDVSDGKSLFGMVNKTANRLGHAVVQITVGGNDSLPASVIEDLRSAVGELESIAKETTFAEEHVAPEDENQEKAVAAEKSVQHVSEKLEMFMNLLNAAGNQSSLIAEPGQGKTDLSAVGKSGPGEKEELRQIVASMQSVVEQCSRFAGQNRMIRANPPQPAEIEAGPDGDYRLTGSSDKAGAAEEAPPVAEKGNAGSSIKTPGELKAGGHPSSPVAFVVEGDAGRDAGVEKTSATGKGTDSGKIEIAFGDTRSKSDSADGDGEALRNGSDNGKVNADTANGNMGIRSFEVTSQSHGQSRNAVSGPSEPVSHEQVLAQVRDRLAAHRQDADNGRITMKLRPEELGELTISMKMENQKLKIDIVADNQAVKEALMQNTDSLRETLSRQNISMERFSVLTGGFGNGETYREWRQGAGNALPNPFRRSAGFAEAASEKNVGYLDSRENSLVDLRL